jgi:ABC-type transport system substrate-binding protein
VLYHAVYSTDVVAAAAAAASMPLGEIVYVPSSLRGEDLGCPDCSLGSMLNLQPMFEPMLYRDLESGAIIEGEGRLAETWSVNDDFTEYQMTLRKGVQFHNGWGEVTTDDVAFSFEKITNENTNNPQAHTFGQMDLIVDDKYSFRLVSEAPAPTVLAALTEMPLAFMVTSKAYWESVGDEKARLHPIGTGPYQFKSHEPGVSITMKAFTEHYRKVPAIAEFKILQVPEFNTRLEMLIAGDADLMLGDYDQIGTAESAGLAISTLTGQRNPAIYLPFFQNPTGAAASDPAPWDSNVYGESGTKVRKALSHLMDRQEIVDYLLAGLGTAEGVCVQSWWPKDPGYDHDCVTDAYDPDAALALLNEAGYDSFGDLAITVELAIHPGFPSCGKIVEAVAQQWTNAGVDVTTQFGDYGTVVESATSAREANYAFCYGTPSYNTAVQLWGFYSRTTDRLSYSGETPEMDELVNNALASEAAGGDFQDSESRKLFDHARANTLGLPVAYADFLYFTDSCLVWPRLPGAIAFTFHNIELMSYKC